MQNVFDVGSEPYVAADPIETQSWPKRFMFFVVLLVDIIKVIVLHMPTLLISIYHCIVGKPKKSVKGQTVLV